MIAHKFLGRGNNSYGVVVVAVIVGSAVLVLEFQGKADGGDNRLENPNHRGRVLLQDMSFVLSSIQAKATHSTCLSENFLRSNRIACNAPPMSVRLLRAKQPHTADGLLRCGWGRETGVSVATTGLSH